MGAVCVDRMRLVESSEHPWVCRQPRCGTAGRAVRVWCSGCSSSRSSDRFTSTSYTASFTSGRSTSAFAEHPAPGTECGAGLTPCTLRGWPGQQPGHCNILQRMCLRHECRYVHSLHHKNTDPDPWSGLCMHPIEHLYCESTSTVSTAPTPNPPTAPSARIQQHHSSSTAPLQQEVASLPRCAAVCCRLHLHHSPAALPPGVARAILSRAASCGVPNCRCVPLTAVSVPHHVQRPARHALSGRGAFWV